jgi:glycosyltransferase involved in cell wall biosynthesis
MNVCFLINHLDTGGAQTLILNMIESTDRPDIEYTVCYVGGKDEMVSEFVKKGVEVIDFGARTELPQLDPRALVHAFRFFGRRDFDIIHTNLTYSMILGRIAGRRAGASVVSTHHSIRRNYHPVERALEAMTQAYDAATVFVSEAVASSFGNRRTRDRALTVYNGIDAKEFNDRVVTADGSGLRADLGVDEETVVLSVGHCIEEKRQIDLVRAVGHLSRGETDPGVHLVVVGDGPVREELRQTVQERGIEAHVSIVGRIPRSEIYRYYACADVYAQVSEYEGMPMTVLEAMASEVPVIGSASPGIEEFVEDGQTGRLVSPKSPREVADAMAALTDEERRQRLGERAYQSVVTEYDITQTAKAYHSLYESVAPS